MVAYILVSTARVFFILNDSLLWVQEQERCADGKIDECFGDINEQLFEVTGAPARWIVKTLVFMGAILCILAYRWRHLASLFIYIDLLIRIAVIFTPNSKIYHSNEKSFTIEILAYGTILYCGDKWSAYLAIITYMWQSFGRRVAYL